MVVAAAVALISRRSCPTGEPPRPPFRLWRVFTTPFRGSAAVAAGLVTRAQLRGPRFRRLFSDVYVLATVEIDLALRARAGSVAVGGVLAGWSAAELLGASCGPADADVEIVRPGGARRSRDGLVVRDERLDPDEIVHVSGVAVTSPLRTALTLACRPSLLDAVIGLDALAHRFGFPPRAVVAHSYRRLGARGTGRLPRVVALSDRLAESPMETRIRFAMHRAGLPAPVLQHPVGPYTLDLAYPDLLLAIEYDGAGHRTQERAMRDLRREAYLARAGWEVLRFRAVDVLRYPDRVAARIAAALVRRGGCPVKIVPRWA